uniref:Uncharacterized protein n=1 Tax=Ciona savignyi TaxID=51511 RepID=H2Z8W7_CIOSA
MKTAIVILLTSVICINKGNSQAVVNAQAGERRDDYDYTGVDCLGDELPCADGENCFRKSKLCDGVYNCLDRSDESNCTSDSTTQSANVTTQAPIVTTLAPTTTTEDDYGAYGGCASGLFDCGDDLCIMTSQRCDGKYDCPDWKDEDGCPNTTVAATSTAVATTTVPDYDGCEANEFQCGNDVCISTGVRCDGRDDCGDFTDEQNCPTSPASTAQAPTSAGTTEPPDYDACAAD